MSDVTDIARKLLAKRDAIETDIRSAHQNRGAGAAGWMREDDRDFRADLANLFDELEAAVAASS